MMIYFPSPYSFGIISNSTRCGDKTFICEDVILRCYVINQFIGLDKNVLYFIFVPRRTWNLDKLLSD